MSEPSTTNEALAVVMDALSASGLKHGGKDVCAVIAARLREVERVAVDLVIGANTVEPKYPTTGDTLRGLAQRLRGIRAP